MKYMRREGASEGAKITEITETELDPRIAIEDCLD
jgi:hypothetical protein